MARSGCRSTCCRGPAPTTRSGWTARRSPARDEVEPIYGPTYLPRKFKAAIAVPPVQRRRRVRAGPRLHRHRRGRRTAGLQPAVGGGMGATHGDADDLSARWPTCVGFLAPGAAARGRRGGGHHAARLRQPRATASTRDSSTRSTPRPRLVHGRDRRAAQGFALEPPRPFEFTSSGDRFGWVAGHRRPLAPDAAHRGRPRRRHAARRRGSPACARSRSVHRGDFRLTPNQNLVIANVEPAPRAVHRRAGARATASMRTRAAAPVRRDALACVALPTCPLAMAEAERYLPALRRERGALLAAHGLRERAAVAAHHRLPERLRAAVPRRDRAGRQGAGPLQPAPRRRRPRPAPERACTARTSTSRRSSPRSTPLFARCAAERAAGRALRRLRRGAPAWSRATERREGAA